MNFIKNSIFCHQPEEEEAYREEPENQMLAVWGSPGCGKTTVASKLAMRLAMAEAGRSTASVRYEYANAALYLSSGGAGRRAFFRKYPRSSPCDGESCAASLYYP